MLSAGYGLALGYREAVASDGEGVDGGNGPSGEQGPPPPPPPGEADGAATSSSSSGDKRKTLEDANKDDNEVYMNCVCTIRVCTSRYMYICMYACHSVCIVRTCMYACIFVYMRVCVRIKSIHTRQACINCHPWNKLNHMSVHIGPFK